MLKTSFTHDLEFNRTSLLCVSLNQLQVGSKCETFSDDDRVDFNREFILTKVI